MFSSKRDIVFCLPSLVHRELAYFQRLGLYSAVPAPTPPSLHGTDDLPPKVLEDVGNIADRVAVGEEVPSAGAVAVVIEPGAEDQICSCREEESVKLLVTCFMQSQVIVDLT
jgi:hypothetical protein